MSISCGIYNRGLVPWGFLLWEPFLICMICSGQLISLLWCSVELHGMHLKVGEWHSSVQWFSAHLVQVRLVSGHWDEMWLYFWHWLHVPGALMSLWILRLDPRCLKQPAPRIRWLAVLALLQKIFIFAYSCPFAPLSGFLIQVMWDMVFAAKLALPSSSWIPSLFMWNSTGMNLAITRYNLPNILMGWPKRVWRNCMPFCLIHTAASLKLASISSLIPQ